MRVSLDVPSTSSASVGHLNGRVFSFEYVSDARSPGSRLRLEGEVALCIVESISRGSVAVKLETIIARLNDEKATHVPYHDLHPRKLESNCSPMQATFLLNFSIDAT